MVQFQNITVRVKNRDFGLEGFYSKNPKNFGISKFFAMGSLVKKRR